MSDDHIRYDLLVREAMRSIVKRVVADAAAHGLPGDHHFYISFDTTAPQVRMSPRLRAQYPEEMTIVLQHQFWDLAATDTAIEVGLSFGGVPEKLSVPYDAIKGFVDPSVQFGLEFEPAAGNAETGAAENAAPGEPPTPMPAPRNARERPARRSRNPAAPSAEQPPVQENLPQSQNLPQSSPQNSTQNTPPSPPADEPKPDAGAQVVSLDRFRKK